MEAEYTVELQHLATSVKSGDKDVLSTPSLLSFIENICFLKMNSVGGNVGVKVELSHLKPSLIDDNIKCCIKHIEKLKKKWIFQVEVFCQQKLIAVCNHTRYFVKGIKI